MMMVSPKNLTYSVLLLLLLPVCLLGAGGDEDSPDAVILKKSEDETTSGDGQTGMVGSPLPAEFVVQVVSGDGKALEGVPVRFSIASQPEGAKGRLEPEIAVTDSEGIARSRMFLGSKEGTYVVCVTSDEVGVRPIYFEVHAHVPGWWIFLLISALGGLAIFIYGMHGMGEGLQRLAGERMKNILGALTSNRFTGLLVGTGVTAVIQSSSATTVMLVGFVNAGLMSFNQSLGVILGANIGTTITAQLIAFKLTEYALLMVAVGFLLIFAGKRAPQKHVGQVLLGFGFVFFGIKVMSDALHPLRDYPPFLKLMSQIENPVLGMLTGAIFTMIVQSSSATTGVAIALGMQGLVTLPGAIALVLGANVGTCVTALLASVGASRTAKRVGLAHVFFNMAGVAIVMPFLPNFMELTASTSDSLPRQIANAHTLFNVIMAVIFLPFLSPYGKLIEKFLPGEPGEKKFEPEYLGKQYLRFASLALEQAKRETIRMAHIVRDMVAKCIEPFRDRDLDAINRLVLEDDKLDILRDAITRYLTSISESELSAKQSRREGMLLRVVAKLEDIGDIVSREILYFASRMIEEGTHFSKEGFDDIMEFHSEVLGTVDKIVEAFEKGDLRIAQKLIDTKVNIVEMEKKYYRAHIARLHRGMKESFETSRRHLDLMTNLRRINSHVVDIAYALVDEVK